MKASSRAWYVQGSPTWLEKVGKGKEGVTEDETMASGQRVMSTQSYANPIYFYTVKNRVSSNH